MYATDNDPTQMIYRSNPGNQRRLWLAVGAGALVVAVLTFLIVVAFQAQGDRAHAALESPVTPTPTVEPTADPGPEAETAEETEGGFGGNQPPQGSNGNQGNQGGGPGPGQDNPGGGDDPGKDPEEEPEEEPGEDFPPLQVLPILPTVSAAVNGPSKLFGCLLATAKITVDGLLLAPMEIKYQFVKFGFVDQPLGSVQSVVFDGAGEKNVTVALPKSQDAQFIYLHISAPQEIKTNVVLYPGCG